MFKLLYLKFYNHPQLKNLEINLVDELEKLSTQNPYTSIIIGPNGSGKSLILRAIIDIFRQFAINRSTEGKLPFSFHIRYALDDHVFEIVTRRLIVIERRGANRDYIAFKDRPFDTSFLDTNAKLPVEKLAEYEIPLKTLQFPQSLLASAIFINDRFPFHNSEPDEFYQYLGVRRTPTATSTGTFTRKIINYLFNAAKSPDFKDRMAEMLGFLEFNPSLSIKYQTRYNTIFFSGTLTLELMEKFYEQWWEVAGVNRKKNNAPWGQWYYRKLKKENPKHLHEIVSFLNESAKDDLRIKNKPRSRAKNFMVDLFNKQYDISYYPFVQDLEKLSIIVLDQIQLKKWDDEIPLTEMSSGENQLILGLMGVFANIKPSSLILIDEPEISLHPNWQLQYISLLKRMFVAYNSCHFIITTHSHFLISELENNSSSIVVLERNNKANQARLLDGINVFGWSAEEILYNIFQVKTVRNYFLEADLTDLLGLISTNSKDRASIQMKLNAIKNLNITPNDPLNAVIEEAQDYLGKL